MTVTAVHVGFDLLANVVHYKVTLNKNPILSMLFERKSLFIPSSHFKVGVKLHLKSGISA